MADYEVKVKGPDKRPDEPEWFRRSEPFLTWLDARLGVRFWTIVGLIGGGVIFGTPHLLINYGCHGRCGQYTTEYGCE